MSVDILLSNTHEPLKAKANDIRHVILNMPYNNAYQNEKLDMGVSYIKGKSTACSQYMRDGINGTYNMLIKLNYI